jgi:hypothetical protein
LPQSEPEKLKKSKKKQIRREWSVADLRAQKAHSEARTPVTKISKDLKRMVGALRAKAFHPGFGLGHQL